MHGPNYVLKATKQWVSKIQTEDDTMLSYH